VITHKGKTESQLLDVAVVQRNDGEVQQLSEAAQSLGLIQLSGFGDVSGHVANDIHRLL
jgi:hypothetical protein